MSHYATWYFLLLDLYAQFYVYVIPEYYINYDESIDDMS